MYILFCMNTHAFLLLWKMFYDSPFNNFSSFVVFLPYFVEYQLITLMVLCWISPLFPLSFSHIFFFCHLSHVSEDLYNFFFISFVFNYSNSPFTVCLLFLALIPVLVIMYLLELSGNIIFCFKLYGKKFYYFFPSKFFDSLTIKLT